MEIISCSWHFFSGLKWKRITYDQWEENKFRQYGTAAAAAFMTFSYFKRVIRMQGKARHIQPLNYWQTNLNSIYTWPGLGFPQTRCEETTLSCALIATKISRTCHLELKKNVTWKTAGGEEVIALLVLGSRAHTTPCWTQRKPSVLRPSGRGWKRPIWRDCFHSVPKTNYKK